MQSNSHDTIQQQYGNATAAQGSSTCDIVTQYQQQAACVLEQGAGAKYDPELDKNLNPHYYEINRLLFEAHMQRLQRALEK